MHFEHQLMDQEASTDFQNYEIFNRYLKWTRAVRFKDERYRLTHLGTRYFYAANCNIDDFWALFCRTFYTYSTGQDAWHKYRYRYNLYRHKTLPPFSTTYTWINPEIESEYMVS